MDIGSLNGQKGVCRTCGQRGRWAAECPKSGKIGQGGKCDDGKGQGKTSKTSKGKTDERREKAKVANGKHERVFEGYHPCGNNYRFDVVQIYCFRINLKL